MQITRRNTLVGLGTIVAGGGALIGSGALSTTEAQRTISVEIIDDANIAGDLVDILFDTTSDQVSVDDGQGTAAEDLFPNVAGDIDTDYGDQSGNVETSDVSLVANDVTIAFSNMVAGSTTAFDEVFKIVSAEGEGTNFTVGFEQNEGSLIGAFVDEGGSRTTSSPPSVDVDIDSNNSETAGIVIETSDSNEEVEDALAITISERDV